MPEIESRLGRWLRLQPLDHIVVIEPDPNLREILMAEIRQAVPVRVAGAGVKECPEAVSGAFCVALQSCRAAAYKRFKAGRPVCRRPTMSQSGCYVNGA